MPDFKKGSTAITIGPNATDATVRDVTMVDFDRGIVSDGQGSRLENNRFIDVTTSIETGPNSSGTATGNRSISTQKKQGKDTVSAGWRRLTGSPLPALCADCGTIFGSRQHVFGGRYWELWNNTELCPECGSEDAKLSEGIFDLTRETIAILSGADITFAMLAALQKAASDIVDGSRSTAEAVADVSQHSQSLGTVLAKWASIATSGVMLLTAVIMAYYSRDTAISSRISADASVISAQATVRQAHAAEEALALQKAEKESPDAATERVLLILKTMRALPGKMVVDESPRQDRPITDRHEAKGKTQVKPGSLDGKKDGAAKARSTKRAAAQDRREALNPKPLRP